MPPAPLLRAHPLPPPPYPPPQPRPALIMQLSLRPLPRFSPFAPRRSAFVKAIICGGVEKHVKRSQLLLVVFVAARRSRPRLQARGARRCPLRQPLGDGLADRR